jgi:hypothetical protein
VGGAEDLRRDFGEDQDGEGDQQGADRKRPLFLAEELDGDDRHQGRRGGVEQIVAEQDHAQHLVGAAQQVEGEYRSAVTFACQMAQAMAVGGHHRRFGD